MSCKDGGKIQYNGGRNSKKPNVKEIDLNARDIGGGKVVEKLIGGYWNHGALVVESWQSASEMHQP